METENLFELSQLAEAAYANFVNVDSGLLSSEKDITDIFNKFRARAE